MTLIFFNSPITLSVLRVSVACWTGCRHHFEWGAAGVQGDVQDGGGQGQAPPGGALRDCHCHRGVPDDDHHLPPHWLVLGSGLGRLGHPAVKYV